MARVTVEDCIDKVDSRFELIMLAARRARELASGAMLTIDRDRDKNPVVALREIAEETISLDELREDLVRVHQKYQPLEEQEEDLASILADDAAGVEEEGILIGASPAPIAEEEDVAEGEEDAVAEGSDEVTEDDEDESDAA